MTAYLTSMKVIICVIKREECSRRWISQCALQVFLNRQRKNGALSPQGIATLEKLGICLKQCI